MSDGTQFYFNVSTGQVEELANKSQSKDLLGPYPTREAATAALQTAQQRNEKWDADDKRYNQGS